MFSHVLVWENKVLQGDSLGWWVISVHSKKAIILNKSQFTRQG